MSAAEPLSLVIPLADSFLLCMSRSNVQCERLGNCVGRTAVSVWKIPMHNLGDVTYI
jgi:hypothetical protein